MSLVIIKISILIVLKRRTILYLTLIRNPDPLRSSEIYIVISRKPSMTRIKASSPPLPVYKSAIVIVKARTLIYCTLEVTDKNTVPLGKVRVSRLLAYKT